MPIPPISNRARVDRHAGSASSSHLPGYFPAFSRLFRHLNWHMDKSSDLGEVTVKALSARFAVRNCHGLCEFDLNMQSIECRLMTSNPLFSLCPPAISSSFGARSIHRSSWLGICLAFFALIK